MYPNHDQTVVIVYDMDVFLFLKLTANICSCSQSLFMIVFSFALICDVLKPKYAHTNDMTFFPCTIYYAPAPCSTFELFTLAKLNWAHS